MIKNIDRVRELKVRLRKCQIICSDLELILNLKERTRGQQGDILIKSLEIGGEISNMQEILEKGE